jgi:hypothetical protein
MPTYGQAEINLLRQVRTTPLGILGKDDSSKIAIRQFQNPQQHASTSQPTPSSGAQPQNHYGMLGKLLAHYKLALIDLATGESFSSTGTRPFWHSRYAPNKVATALLARLLCTRTLSIRRGGKVQVWRTEERLEAQVRQDRMVG